MHGRKRETLEESLARREATLPKVKLIRALQDDAIRRRVEKRYDAESMAVTERLLEINPEVFTAWNFRREAIVSLAERAQEAQRRRIAQQQSTAAAGAAAAAVEGAVDGLSLAEEEDIGDGDGVASSGGGVSRDEASGPGTATTTTTTEKEGDGKAPAPPPAFVPPLEDELALTEKTLRKNPKSYPSWHHRKWTVRRLVEQARAAAATAAAGAAAAAAPVASETAAEDEKILSREMKLCAALLTMDDRNFHCWGYRRFVVELRGAPDAEELDYTTSKIETNFSNYSAWHHRSTYLPRVHGVKVPADHHHTGLPSSAPPSEEQQQRCGSSAAAEGGNGNAHSGRRLPRDVLDAEYELVQQAFFTEPEDQSGWMYHRWLLGNTLGEEKAAAGAGAAAGGAAAGAGAPAGAGFEAEKERRQPADEVVEILKREAELCRELMEMEPDSKWPVVTLARLCQATGSAESRLESVGSFKRLETLDPMRSGYYCDCCRR